jgi:hypothetical protein
MKLKLVILLFCYLSISPAGCNDKNIQPDFPPNLPLDKRDGFMQRWTAGKELFKTNCSRCHGVFKKDKDTAMNFSQKQIDSYNARFLARDPKNHAVVRQMSEADFYKVLIFLTYLKRARQDVLPLMDTNNYSMIPPRNSRLGPLPR